MIVGGQKKDIPQERNCRMVNLVKRFDENIVDMVRGISCSDDLGIGYLCKSHM